MNVFQKQRREKLEQLLGEPQDQYPEQLEELSEFVEREIATAYKRGYRDGARKPERRPARGDRS